MFKKIISFLLVLTLLSVSSLSSVFAAHTNKLIDPMSVKGYNNILYFKPSAKAINFTRKMIDSGLIKEFSLNKDGKITLDKSYDSLKSEYNLDESDINNLKIVAASLEKINYNGNIKNINQNNIISSKNVISPMLSVSGWKIYFTYNDVVNYLGAAASAGPIYMIAALDALGVLTGGAVGTVIDLILDIVGAASMANLCYLAIQAMHYHEGIYIGIEWNGVFPNYVQGFWKGK
ncbi:hypothetical protein ACETAC_01805 [Aceticella autotrophica]|uniref:Uncharacterized protein n=1 Tax=Aceticella autotrophica TaxID=2755338 RepID=A0A975AWF1_9THEO|nr:hypothetical protein [Aceticella autotrophica]QSZ27663.1 hypothetical protein ACETAC_01805 [Aceticella autotrophica]